MISTFYAVFSPIWGGIADYVVSSKFTLLAVVVALLLVGKNESVIALTRKRYDCSSRLESYLYVY